MNDLNELLTDKETKKYLDILDLTIEEIIKKAYQDGYRSGYQQAVKDMQHFEETGVVIL
jgi:hypothetical protein